jgi:pyruvate dehydrogenase E1 component alpha subunit
MIERDRLHDIYYRMQLTRAFNDELMALKKAGKVYGPIHRSTGQEAVGIAVGALLRDDDYIISNHRGYAHWIGKDIDMRGLSAEIFGKAEGVCKGKAGEMLIADLRKGILSTTIIGGGLTLAVGLGMSIRMRKGDQVVVCYFGDGASNEGTFHEALNFGALQKVPVVFLCENNQYALSVHVSRSTSVRDIAKRAAGYDIPGYIVDGNDVFDVYNLLGEVVPELRAGGGPVLIEAKTYRLGSFSSNDRESGYQPQEEIDRWKAKDPIVRFRQQLLDLGVSEEGHLTSLDNRAREVALDMIAYGQKADYPREASLYDEVFVS